MYHIYHSCFRTFCIVIVTKILTLIPILALKLSLTPIVNSNPSSKTSTNPLNLYSFGSTLPFQCTNLSLFHPRLHVCPNTSLFASASNDGTVKLWDAERVEKQGMVVKSCFTFQLQQGETPTRKWKLARCYTLNHCVR